MKKAAWAFGFVLGGFFFLTALPVEATLFDNTSSTIPGVCQLGTSGSEHFRYVGVFSSSTQVFDLRDVSFKTCVVGGGAAATTTQVLHIESGSGGWSATTTVFAPTCTVGGAYTTSTFGSGTAVWQTTSGTFTGPIAGPGDGYAWTVSSADTRTGGLAPGIATAESPIWYDQFDPLGMDTCYQPGYVTTTGVVPQIVVNGTPIAYTTPPQSGTYGFSTTTAQGQDLGFFGNMFRDVFAYLFVPNGYALAANVSNLKASVSQKFPFSYIYGLQQDITASMAENSSTELGLALDFSTFIPTTTAFGTFMPTSTVLFSTSTMTTYGGTSAWTILRWLITCALWFGLCETIYYGARNLLKKPD